MNSLIAVAALLMAVIAFALFAAIVWKQLQATPEEEADPELTDTIADTATALSKLVDSLSGAKPAVLCLLASLVFTFVAQQAAEAAGEAAAAAAAVTPPRACGPAQPCP